MGHWALGLLGRGGPNKHLHETPNKQERKIISNCSPLNCSLIALLQLLQ
jgi:hypothetical protein